MILVIALCACTCVYYAHVAMSTLATYLAICLQFYVFFSDMYVG